MRRLSPEAAHLLYRLLSEGNLILLPMGIATSQAQADAITTPWPQIKVVESASELHAILQRGPFAWWRDAPFPEE